MGKKERKEKRRQEKTVEGYKKKEVSGLKTETEYKKKEIGYKGGVNEKSKEEKRVPEKYRKTKLAKERRKN